MKAYSSKAIANEFIRLAQNDGGLTHMQIQKLVYFAHAMNLATYNEPLIRETFQAWPFGPVDVKIYLEFKGSGKTKIKELIENVNETIDERSKQLIEIIYDRLGKKSGWELSDFSHKESPWKSVFEKGKSNPITNDSIIKYYRSKEQ